MSTITIGSSAPAAWHFMMREAGPFAMPRIVANMRQHRIAATEQGPEANYLDVETNG